MAALVLEKSITEVISLLRKGAVCHSELLASCYKRIEQIKSLNAFISVVPKEKLVEESRNKDLNASSLCGIPYAVKDNFSTEGISTTCGSAMLQDYVPTYNATVVDKISFQNGLLVGKTNMDEFAMGSGSVESLFGPVRNPWAYYDFENDGQKSDWFVAGGSSGGSAIAVAAGASYFAIGSDTGGSVRIPASFCGVVGLKPTYGSISRHGLISLVNSLDVPGIFTRTVDDTAFVFNMLSGHDVNDSTSVRTDRKPVQLNKDESVKNLVVGIPQEYHGPGLSHEVVQAWRKAADQFANAGAIVKQVSMPHTRFSIFCYQVLGCGEIASNFARYDGLEYGHRSSGRFTEELYARSRNEGFGETVRRRIMAGNYFLLRKNYDTYYDKALRVRRLVTEDFKSVFHDGVDVLLTPVTVTTAPRYSEFSSKSGDHRTAEHDVYTQAANMSGVPAVSVPVTLSDKKLPIGLQLMADAFREDVLLKAAKFLEQRSNFPQLQLNF